MAETKRHHPGPHPVFTGLRTRETLAAVNNELGVGHIVYEEDIYGASLGALLDLIERHSQNCANLMITGHNRVWMN